MTTGTETTALESQMPELIPVPPTDFALATHAPDNSSSHAQVTSTSQRDPPDLPSVPASSQIEIGAQDPSPAATSSAQTPPCSTGVHVASPEASSASLKPPLIEERPDQPSDIAHVQESAGAVRPLPTHDDSPPSVIEQSATQSRIQKQTATSDPVPLTSASPETRPLNGSSGPAPATSVELSGDHPVPSKDDVVVLRTRRGRQALALGDATLSASSTDRASILSSFYFPPPPEFDESSSEVAPSSKPLQHSDSLPTSAKHDLSFGDSVESEASSMGPFSPTLRDLKTLPPPNMTSTPLRPEGGEAVGSSADRDALQQRRHNRPVIVYDLPVAAIPERRSLWGRVRSAFGSKRTRPETPTSPSNTAPRHRPGRPADVAEVADALTSLAHSLDEVVGDNGEVVLVYTLFLRAPVWFGRTQSATSAQTKLNLSARRVIIHRTAIGFGFAINGESPVFITTVVPGGPSDKGLAGLLPRDIILKVNGTPCPRGPRTHVVALVKNTPPGQPLELVVCRTPEQKRKRFGGASTLDTNHAESHLATFHRTLWEPPNDSSQGLSETVVVPPSPSTIASPSVELTTRPTNAVPVSPPALPNHATSTSQPAAPRAAALPASSPSIDTSQASTTVEVRRLRDIGESDYSGWLKKKTGAVVGAGDWKRRYFVLFGSRMAYFKKATPNAKPCGVLELQQCRIQRTRETDMDNTFRVICKEFKNLLLAAPTQTPESVQLELKDLDAECSAEPPSRMLSSAGRPASMTADDEFAQVLAGLQLLGRDAQANTKSSVVAPQGSARTAWADPEADVPRSARPSIMLLGGGDALEEGTSDDPAAVLSPQYAPRKASTDSALVFSEHAEAETDI
ncbi:uncharacterized protein MONBRDRAFT_7155 [Monosiga brevicollis MX1]|uniref:PDZ domain-containing protein n=1 Tax=Monosiga brevicollis TaxID=81824 RepID=A9UW37_MONBE|nr:uncharacterized protein MONBRDRAFT_7155 [Monosiga brevicollis MX1]EDQ90493.1 predicted protein [Monosiga brevicollis MX1]|eukprot:XP_001744544.1 hypothetical protein [Monosiga brevicollis MX1]